METPWKPKHNPWIIAVTVTLATIMEVLDTSIANVALPHIAGALGASQDESTWVITSYLVATSFCTDWRFCCGRSFIGGFVYQHATQQFTSPHAVIRLLVVAK
jgi:MFS family permease